MVTGTVSIYQLPTGTIDALTAVFPLDINVTGTPQTIQSSLQQTIQFLRTNVLDAAYQPSGTALTGDWQNIPATLTFVSADSPSYVVTANANITGTFPVGTKMRVSHLGTTKYFINTQFNGVTGSTTYLNLYGGTDYTLTTGSITSPVYSNMKTPYGFPMNPDKWTVFATGTSNVTQATPVNGTWYNIISIVAPIGIWEGSYSVPISGTSTAAQTAVNVFSTLSTANNSESDKDWTAAANNGGASGVLVTIGTVFKKKVLSFITKTSLFLNFKTTTTNASIDAYGSSVGTIIIALKCAFL